jgi:two-component system OmpR family response regulator
MEGTESKPTRLLIVEDDADLNQLFARIARREGYDIVQASTGEEALQILRDSSGQIDWLLTDIRLPGVIDGWVVGSEFTLSHPLRPVIYVSGLEKDSSRRASNSLFVRKPVQISELISLFRRMSIEEH